MDPTDPIRNNISKQDAIIGEDEQALQCQSICDKQEEILTALKEIHSNTTTTPS